MRFPRLLGFAAAIGLCSAAAWAKLPNPDEHLYILSFNAWGELQNPAERDFAIEELRRTPDIERIFILSYGWANDGRASYTTYRKMLEQMVANAPVGLRPRKIAVIAVAWDSSQTGFRKLTTDLIPLPGVGEAIAWLPDKVLFPISFWSKAAQADRIGYGGLRRALNEIFAIYDDAPKHPEVFLVGHSFGTRVVSALMVSGKGQMQPRAEIFQAAGHVRGAVLLQPALVGRNLDQNAQYPVMITMSRHDHAVGFMYPIANIPLNAFGFSLFESLIQRHLLVPMEQTMEQTVGATTNLVGSIVPTQMPGLIFRSAPAVTAAPPTEEFGPPSPEGEAASRPEASTSDEEPAEARRKMVVTARRHGRRTMGELLAIPVTLGFTLVATPIDYLYVQGRGLATRPFSHIMDTLAQLPVVEIPVDGLSRLFRPDNPWGQRSKGLFTLGPIHDGMGRMVAPELIGKTAPVYSLAEVQKMPAPPNGPFAVDASSIVRKGGFGIDMGSPLIDYTVGWIAPIGAHSDFTNKEVMALLSWVVNGSRPPTPGGAEAE